MKNKSYIDKHCITSCTPEEFNIIMTGNVIILFKPISNGTGWEVRGDGGFKADLLVLKKNK